MKQEKSANKPTQRGSSTSSDDRDGYPKTAAQRRAYVEALSRFVDAKDLVTQQLAHTSTRITAKYYIEQSQNSQTSTQQLEKWYTLVETGFCFKSDKKDRVTFQNYTCKNSIIGDNKT
jgi:hypothetical protein